MLRQITNILMKCFLIFKKTAEKGLFHIFFSSSLNSVISFASSIIVVRIVSKEDYGVYAYALNIFSLFMIISGLGLVSGLLQKCSEKEGAKYAQDLYVYARSCGVIANIFLAAIILITAFSISMPVKGTNSILALMCLLPVVSFLFGIRTIWFRIHLKNKQFALANNINSICISIFSIAGAVFFSVKGLIAGRYIAFCISLILITLIIEKQVDGNSKNLDKEAKTDLWKISLISAANGGISQLVYLLGIFILGIMLPDNTIIASYKTATTVPNGLVFIPTAFVTFIYPYFAKHNNDKKYVKHKFFQSLLVMAVLNGALALIMYVFAPLIIGLLFGSQYLDAVTPFRILAIAYFIGGTFRMLAGNLLITQRKLKFNFFVAIFGGAINIIANVILIPTFKSNGAAYAQLITVLVTGAMNTSYLIYCIGGKK